jgi:hypothetical protein
MTHFDGDVNCPQCKGRGVVPVIKTGIEVAVQVCKCRLAKDVLANVERRWKGLVKSSPIKSSPLLGKETENLWVTGAYSDFKRHMRHVAIRSGPMFYFQRITDVDLLDAWLGKATPLDPDVSSQRQEGGMPVANSLSDLVAFSDLLVILTGVKAAPNRCSADCLIEALHLREQMDKPTWIVDSPQNPLNEGHLFWDYRVGDILGEMEHVKIGSKAAQSGPVELSFPEDGRAPVEFRPPTPEYRPTATPKPAVSLFSDSELFGDKKSKFKKKGFK